MKRISLLFLWLEAVALAVVTVSLLGGMGMISVSAIKNGSVDVIAVTIGTFLIGLAGIVCGWRLLIAFLLGGQLEARSIDRWWWRIGAGALILSVAAAAGVKFIPDDEWPPALFPLEFLGFGLVFLPTFIHLSAEVWLRSVGMQP